MLIRQMLFGNPWGPCLVLITEEELGGVEGFDLSAVTGKCVQCADIGQYTRSSSPTLFLTITHSEASGNEGRLEVLYNGERGVSDL